MADGPMTFLLLAALLLAIVLLAFGLSGRRPLPAEGRWVALSPSARAALIVVAFSIALGALAQQAGWLGFGRPVPRVWSSAAVSPENPAEGARAALPPAPAAPLWNEADRAQQQAAARGTSAAAVLPASGSTPAAEPAAPAAAENARVPAPAAPAAAPAVAATPAPVSAAPACACPPAAPRATPAVRPAGRGPAPRRPLPAGDDRLLVCDVQRGLVRLPAAASIESSATVATLATVVIRNRLGSGQRAEVLLVSVDGVPVRELRLGSGRRSGSVQLRLPAGAARYVLSGYTEFVDGHRVAIAGEGWIDAGQRSFDVRTADADHGGQLFLEPT